MINQQSSSGGKAPKEGVPGKLPPPPGPERKASRLKIGFASVPVDWEP